MGWGGRFNELLGTAPPLSLSIDPMDEDEDAEADAIDAEESKLKERPLW